MTSAIKAQHFQGPKGKRYRKLHAPWFHEPLRGSLRDIPRIFKTDTVGRKKERKKKEKACLMLRSFCFNNGDTEEYKAVAKIADRGDQVM